MVRLLRESSRAYSGRTVSRARWQHRARRIERFAVWAQKSAKGIVVKMALHEGPNRSEAVRPVITEGCIEAGGPGRFRDGGWEAWKRFSRSVGRSPIPGEQAASMETGEATAHTTAASHRVGNSPRGGGQSQSVSPRVLVDERNEHRATRVDQRVVAETRRAGLEGTMDRAALRTAESPRGPVAR
jgi:hypothetical protein